MNTFETLTDAFTELERRADAAAQQSGDAATPFPVRRHTRAPLVAATVVTTLAVAGGAALLAHGGSGHQAGGASPAEPTNSQPAVSTTVAADPAFRIPQTAGELADRFRVVLGDLATFTVTDSGTPMTVTVPAHTVPPTPTVVQPRIESTPIPIPNSGTPNGAAIVGVLTSQGVSGGYDIQIFQNDPGTRAMCDDPDRSRCTTSATADGGSLAVGREPLPNSPDAVTYDVDLIRADGVEFLMHLSNERDPKGESLLLAPAPPLTTEEMVSIVTSDRW
jgi:hypothetical protein